MRSNLAPNHIRRHADVFKDIFVFVSLFPKISSKPNHFPSSLFTQCRNYVAVLLLEHRSVLVAFSGRLRVFALFLPDASMPLKALAFFGVEFRPLGGVFHFPGKKKAVCK